MSPTFMSDWNGPLRVMEANERVILDLSLSLNNLNIWILTILRPSWNQINESSFTKSIEETEYSLYLIDILNFG